MDAQVVKRDTRAVFAVAGTELVGDPVADQGFDSTASEDGLVDMTDLVALRKP